MGRGGLRRGAGRSPNGPTTVEEAVHALERLLVEIKRPAYHRDTAMAGKLARQLFRDAMRLRRRLLKHSSSSVPTKPMPTP